MKNKKLLRFTQSTLIVALAAVLLCGALMAPAKASSYKASFIDNLGKLLNINYQDYLDSNAMFRLPDGVKDDDKLSVIIKLSVDDVMTAYESTDKSVDFTEYALYSADSVRIQETIAQRKAQILSKLDEQGVEYTTGKEYFAIMSGFEVIVKAKDFKTTCKSLAKGETAIISQAYKPAETKLVENTVNVYDTGIFNSSGAGYDGSGMVVAVLDTGLDSNHSAFSVNNFTSTKLGLTYSQVAALVGQTKANELYGGLTADDVYVNTKVPFAYDYADNDPDVYSTHNNHGTHVSGVIVGKDNVITGVAPNAQLVSMKVFSDVEDSALSSWILDALEDCVILGVDVINMSLGTACGFGRESDEEQIYGVYDKIRDAGISLIVAASNSYSSAYGSDKNGNLGLTSNPDTGTVGSPGTYMGAMSVASINGKETPYILYDNKIIYFDEANSGAAKELSFFDTLLGNEQSKSIEYIVIPGVGRSADYTGVDVTGKIVLVRRGDNTFEEKAMIAQSKGAAGIIIYNNVSGEIKMNVGDATLAVCSISQDDGEILAQAGGGTLTISKTQTSGPFISDFSSWGPTPSLGIKPEITAHGGNILSSITGGGYDRLSGTSMACPNLAGVAILMRQYVVENFPDIANDNVKVNAMVNKLMMSTADIILNTNGLPYAVRKQGAGLANLGSSLATKAYITTYDKNGAAMDKTKLELGDDPSKSGVYTMKFTVTNFGSQALTYTIGGYVMTEGVSDTKTNAGETTVTEQGYLLGASVAAVTTSTQGGSLSGNSLTVNAGQSMDVTVTVTLSDADKAYLNDSFANGMYVEGFVTLTATAGTSINMNVPFLAFFGDWTQAPMFDLTYYETNADELDNGIDEEDKTKADAYPTRLVGGISEDYVSYLGSYYFMQDSEDMVISANKDYISLSNQEGTVHSLRFMWTGMLRNASKVVVTITDDTTGEVVYEVTDTDIRKSYGDGGSIYPANVEIEFDTMDYNLANNSKYTVSVVGYLDYKDGGITTNKKNTYTFPLTVDFEAPTVTDVEFYYNYDKAMKKNRLYAKVAVYDNHFTMASQLGMVAMGQDENGEAIPEMKAFEQYMTPVYSKENSTTYVTFELTDYIYQIKENALNNNSFAVTVYDYALNYATYEIGMPDDYVDFYFDGLEEGLTLSPNEVFSMEPLVYPNASWGELLEFASSRTSVVRVVNNKLVAVGSGNAIIRVRDPQTNKSITFPVTVLKEGDEGFRRFDKPVADVFRLDGFTTHKAYYMLSSEDKKLGDTGDTRFFEGRYALEMYPSESVLLNYTLDAFFPKDTTVEFESSNENIVSIDASGVVTARAEGFASVTVKVIMDGKSTYYSESVSVEVKDPFVTNGASLSHYYGNGGVVIIPDDLSLTDIGNFAFSNFEYISKTPEELEEDDRETTKQWFIGDNTVTKVVIPEGVEKIGAYAFANLTALEEVVLPSTLESIEYGAFYGCSSLRKITFSGDNNLKIINQHAFEGCDLRETIDLSAVCVISDYAFAGNQQLKGIVTSDSLLSIGQYAFASCKKLETVTITAQKVKYGPYAFTGCESLTSFYVNASVLPAGMFYECKSMTKVTIGPDVNTIGEFAFRDTAIATITVGEGNSAYKVGSGAVVLSADGTTICAVAPTVTGTFNSQSIDGAEVTVIGYGAFSHNTQITAVNLPNVTVLEDYAFGSSTDLRSVKLGDLAKIGKYAFFETDITELPKFTASTAIGKYAFSFTDITSVTIPDGMIISEGVFSECMKLNKVVIGDNVTIGKFAFTINKDSIYTVKKYQNTKYYCYEFNGPLTSLTIGDNAVIGENAFSYQAGLESVTLGGNAQIGKMAFYNAAKLKRIDLSKAQSIGEYAFSGDVYMVCIDSAMGYAAVSNDGYYIYTYYAPALEQVDLSAATSIGEYAFTYCKNLKKVTLGDGVTVIPQLAFAYCDRLESINLSKVVTIGDNAFAEDRKLKTLDLSSVESIGEYAFVYGEGLISVKLNPNGCKLAEGVFCYNSKLANVDNLSAVIEIGDYAFAYTAITDADLSGAVSIGNLAFIKEKLTPFTVKLGSNLKTLGDNPFAMCKIAPFSTIEKVTFNGIDYEGTVYTYNISDTVFVIDGSLYCKVNKGLELITYAGISHKDVQVAKDTVRITSMAFAGSDVEMVTMPHTTTSIGHKAFYDCNKLHTVVFGSYTAPILEEEFDPSYYDSLENIPGSGDYGTYTDYNGNEVKIESMNLIPYFMWNATDGMYSNVFYGANFVDYVGYVSDKLIMVRPANGQNYDSFIYSQYFDLVIDGNVAPDTITLAAMQAIDAIPERVTYEHKALVEAARAAYNRIATKQQQALAESHYSKLISAEQRIQALTPVPEEPSEPPVVGEVKSGNGWIWIVVAAVLVLAAGGAAYYAIYVKKVDLSALLAKLKAGKREEEVQDEENEIPAEETDSQDEKTSEE